VIAPGEHPKAIVLSIVVAVRWLSGGHRVRDRRDAFPSCNDRSRFQDRSGNHIDLRRRCLRLFSALELRSNARWILSTLYAYGVILHVEMPLGEASRQLVTRSSAIGRDLFT
jgi:hypothetical protein